MKRRCPKCGAAWETDGPIGFREECPECAAFMHTCSTCKRYDPGAGVCRLPNTEPVRAPQGVNFCEEFEYQADPRARGRPAAPPDSGQAEDNVRRRFEDLFQDCDP